MLPMIIKKNKDTERDTKKNISKSHVQKYADRRNEMYKNTEKDQKGGRERGAHRETEIQLQRH